MKHEYISVDIQVTTSLIESYAKKYIEQRGSLLLDPTVLSREPAFNNTGFNVSNLQAIINRHTVPKRLAATSNQPKHLDIYRSDLGELIMTTFFEEEISTQLNNEHNFIIPLKNIWDRETNNVAGRGVDTIGYRCTSPNKPTLLLGESKVSSEKRNPPRVVDNTDDSLYKTHLAHATDKEYLLNKLCNHSKKLQVKDMAIVSAIIFGLELEDESMYDIVYGCSMIRDIDCIDVLKDYGKLLSNKDNFDPNFVYFYLPKLTEPIDDVVNKFYLEVNKILTATPNNDN